MKNFKRFLVLFCITSLMFTTCVFAKTDYKYNPDDVKKSVDELVSSLLEMNQTELEYYVNNSVGWTREACETLLGYTENGSLGAYKECEPSELKEDGQVLVVTITAHFEKADLKITTSLTDISDILNVVDMQFELVDTGNKSLGERMANAAFNAVIGIVSVFLVLLLISFVISLFKYIPKIQEAFKNRKKGSAEEALESAIAQIEQNEKNTDDTELIAVITAAICAATGKSSDSFVVRSIRKADRKKR